MIKYTTIDMNDIGLIKELWEKLNLLHSRRSKYFEQKFKSFSFENRIKFLFKKSEEGKVRIDIVKDDDKYIGYCISSIDENLIGGVESIFLEEEYRGSGIGEQLMERSMNWMDDNQISKCILGVAYGNENVLSFYQKFGFYPRTTILEKK
ncbi:GNAT family N-acetyltransferase [Brassicibacter mesophilus]|uniref:GNAT family N-acetyltransferase n=1 Tax=Brassicibacter mesophilus TaxID=745119 RepID=UPI003D194D4F